MRIGKNETEQRTKTRSAAYMLVTLGHTAVIMLDGISGCYALDRVREAQLRLTKKATIA